MGNEIEAMSQIDTALTALEADERGRVLTWAVAKFGGGAASNLALRAPSGTNGGGADEVVNIPADDDATTKFTRVSDLIDAANPTNGLDYVLLGSYWFQEVQGAESFTGQQVNSMLKDLGHGAANITTAYNSLKSRKPPLARQIQKSGTSQQARKQYRLTAEGIKAVERMISGKYEA
jgi:hypothetical protein